MSLPSYNRNLECGATGPGTPTCWSGCLEQMFPRGELYPEHHNVYGEFVIEYNDLSCIERFIANPRFGEVFNHVVGKLCRKTWEDCEFKKPMSASALGRYLNQYVYDGYKVVLELDVEDESHAVGVKPTGYYSEFKLTSTWLPKELEGIVTPTQLFKHLIKPEDFYIPSKYWRDPSPFDYATLLAIPPAAA